ncbi:alkylated DNA repair protein alkB-like protein 1 [Nematocida minor]|uniref:alkylated DNA repair protein alkB-like protein 1 n=1 Tax=Nematocida minor TaxID=1912983 RepID=UPI00221FFD4C|nr:alkylated DNA repair protein alkB-like protein 1 [Nematocida minor]KAI5190012.1 alkylated DNA repair protein alkB-like protein 1 [Nematocida minor]
MQQNKLREIEKMHMHSDTLPAINSSNAHLHCARQETISLDSTALKDSVTIYYFKGGFIFIPNPLRAQVKNAIVKTVLTELLYPPYKNSIDRSLDIENADIYKAYLEKKELQIKLIDAPKANIKIRQDPYASQEEKDIYNSGIIKIKPEELIKKIRWSSIGIYYDWELKAYDKSIVSEIPHVILETSKEISEKICKVSFTPETAVINYYQEKDRIMSHIDRYEEDMSKPLISYSFGCSCVFVLGKKERTDPSVDTFLLEDGDIAILMDESREYLHGVPKILKNNAGMKDYADTDYSSLISSSRINISIRQAYKYEDA